MKIPTQVISVLCVIAALWLASYCGERRGAERQKLKTETAKVDTIIVRNDSVYRDSLRRAERTIARLREAIRPVETLPDSAPVLRAQIVARDSVIRADSLLKLFFVAQIAQRDSTIKVLQTQRNAFQKRSEKRFACVFLGPGVTAGLDGRVAYGLSFGCGWRL